MREKHHYSLTTEYELPESKGVQYNSPMAGQHHSCTEAALIRIPMQNEYCPLSDTKINSREEDGMEIFIKARAPLAELTIPKEQLGW